MLGRLVDQYVLQNESIPPESIWGDVLPAMLEADLRLVNLECVISTRGEMWRPLTKPFHFRACPRALDFLRAARVDCMTLANNHTLDYGVDALEECLDLLDREGLPHAGAGRNLDESMRPALLETPQGRIGVVALTDNEPEWEAGPDSPGTFYVAYNAHGLVEPYRSRVAQSLAKARSQAGFVAVSAHVGPNWGKPSPAMQATARQIIEMGADLYWGHSNHTPQGIEVYQGKPILYSTGDFVDDYAVDAHERNDLSFLFVVDVDMDAQAGRVREVDLHPTAIEHFRVRRARGDEVRFLHRRMSSLSAEFGTTLQAEGDLLVLAL